MCYGKLKSMKSDNNLNQLIRIIPQNEGTAKVTVSNLHVTHFDGMLNYKDMESNAVVCKGWDLKMW